MNAYYNNISTRRLTSAPRRARTSTSSPSIIGRLLTYIDSLLAALSGTALRARALLIARVAVTTLCFFGFIGVVGGLEADKLSWPAGFAIVAVLALVECLCLRKIKK